MFPDAYVKEFQKVLDRVKPFPFEAVQRTLDEELGAEKAAHLVDIAPRQLASASIAQVHSANLRDGTPVVIKVQRPGIVARCMADMKLMRMLAGVVARFKKGADLANPVGVVDDFTKTLTEELDFRKEAANLDRFNEIMRELGHKHIRAPVPHHEYTTRKVLVMERFLGLRVDRFDEIKRRGIDGESKLVDGLRAWFQCVVFYGFFHGDVHAGNLMLLDDDTIGFLDFGIVGRFDDKERYLVTDYMIAFASGNYRRLAEIICEMAGKPPGLDMDGFIHDLGETYRPLLTLSFGELNYAELPARHPAHRDPPPREDAQRVHPDHQAAPVLRSLRQGARAQAQRVHRSAARARHDAGHPEGADGRRSTRRRRTPDRARLPLPDPGRTPGDSSPRATTRGSTSPASRCSRAASATWRPGSSRRSSAPAASIWSTSSSSIASSP